MKMKGMIAVAAMLATASVQASNWTGGNGDWSSDAGWGGTQPTAADMVNHYSSSTLTVTQAGEVCAELRLGNTAGNAPVLNVTGGDLTTAVANVGYNDAGTVNVTGGAVNSSSIVINAGGSAAVSGSGSWTSGGYLYVGISTVGNLDVATGGTVSRAFGNG